MVRLPSINVMQRAFAEKDPSFDGTFFVGVKTTSIFCRPVCRAKRALAKNIEFFPTAQSAQRAGYRACKLCRPLETPQPPALMRQLLDLVEQKQRRITERDLREIGIEPTTARRQFRAAFKTTFSAWQRSRQLGKAIHKLKQGTNMTTAQLTAGFESSSGFRDALAKFSSKSARVSPLAASRIRPSELADPRSRKRRESRGDGSTVTDAALLIADWMTTPLGPMLAIADDDGIVMLEFVDDGDLESAIARLKRNLGDCSVAPGEHRHLATLRKQLAEYFAGAREEFTVPLNPHGTDFELSVWNYLRKIPYGETRSYGQQARAIGKPAASRAVGAANGRNDIGILIPCHRVIGAGGSLVGYGGGLERKKWLLNHEREVRDGKLF